MESIIYCWGEQERWGWAKQGNKEQGIASSKSFEGSGVMLQDVTGRQGR